MFRNSFRSTFSSLFGSNQKDPLAERALNAHAEMIKHSPGALVRGLEADITYLSSIIQELEPYEIDEIETFDLDAEDTIIPSSSQVKEVEVSTYSPQRLNKLLIKVGNYHHWLKKQSRANKATQRQKELIMYLTFSDIPGVKSFPLVLTDLVEKISEQENPHLMSFYHSQLLNQLVTLREELV